MKTTWNIIHKETSKLTNENNIKSLFLLLLLLFIYSMPHYI